ncbi:hypothetical protein CcCBS67573_g00072 [Chytriomyces confervae]|uniref:E3 ubiquitin-protein ligase n=1 Tax=Chytriomyces confervae TaxID=246404 RepID=A0A507FSY2_9FUNG|nr:hypothetical protein CcCBS67573_g00072 [Chytriomyces confervae]
MDAPLYVLLHTLHKKLFSVPPESRGVAAPDSGTGASTEPFDSFSSFNSLNPVSTSTPNSTRLFYPLHPLPLHLKQSVASMLDAHFDLHLPVSAPDTNATSQSDLDAPEYQPNRRGHPCGHVFAEGEGVFWCRNCALDETCVMCHNCFHASNHDGHDTTFHLSKGGGCCDCGDAQAWRVPVQCAFHSSNGVHPNAGSKNQSVEEDSETRVPTNEAAINAMRATISTALDFIIDTFNASPTNFTLPTRLESVLSANPPEPGDEDCGANLENVEFKRDMFVCILWNDESHTFDEVIAKVRGGTNCSEERAAEVAVTVDAVGREVISSSYQIARLLSIARSINENRSTGLSLTIRTVRDTFRENVASFLVEWLRDLPSRVRGEIRGQDGRLHESLVAVVRRLICEELCAPRRKVKDKLIGEYVGALNKVNNGSGSSGSSVSMQMGETGDAAAIRALNQVYGGVKSNHMDSDGDVSMGEHSTSGDRGRWRIDYLIGFDSRLWKQLRGTLKGLYIETLVVSGDEYKKAMALRFCYTYPLTANSYLVQDREYDLSIMTFTVQLFTVPSVSEYLMANTSIVHCLCATLKALFLSDHYATVFPYTDLLKSIRRANRLIRPQYTKLNCESTNDRVYKDSKYSQIFNDIKYFFASPLIRMNLLRNGNLSEFASFLDLCRVMQGMYPQKRHIRTHIEYESQAWTNSFYLSSNISRILEHVGDAFAPTTRSRLKEDLNHLVKAIKLTLKALDDWCAQEQLQEFAEWDRAVNERVISSQRAGTPFTPPIRSLDGFIPISYCQIPPSQRVLDFKALGRSVSLHVPLHWVLAKLLACLAQFGVEMAKQTGTADAFHLRQVLSVEDIQEPKPKDLKDLSFVQDLDDWSLSGLSNSMDVNDSVNLPYAIPVPALLQQISQEDHIVRILDHPLRTEVFLSQIRTNLWVRNGLNIRNQHLYFKYILLRDVYDLDVFLVQTFACMASSDRFIATLLDRYDVRAWFEGNVVESAKKFFGDTLPSVGLSEDLLNLLIYVITERMKPSGRMDVESLARREIIHVLATSPSGGLPYSKITESIPYEITRLLQGLPVPIGADLEPQECYFSLCKSFDTILGEVAVFKPPTMTSDKGVYVLRDECFEEVDPWFHHYARTQREEVEATLLQRIVKRNGGEARIKKMSDAARSGSLTREAGGSWEEMNRLANRHGLTLPKISLMPMGSGFSGLDSLSCGKSFALILLMALFNLTRGDDHVCQSDHAMASIVHLLQVAVEIDLLRAGSVAVGERFVDQAGHLYQFEVMGPAPCSLVGKVLEIIDRGTEDAFKDHVEKLSLFIVRLSAFGTSCAASEQIAAWQHKNSSVVVQESGTVSPAEAEREKRKAESKMRQAAIMAKFAQQQKSFLDENSDDDSELDASDEDMDADKHANESSFLAESRSWNFPGGNCIMCQEELKDDRLYGMLCLTQPCYIQRSRYVDFRDAKSVISTMESVQGGSSQPAVYEAEPGSNSIFEKFPRSVDLSSREESPDAEMHASSCGHLMHLSCFEQYFTSIEGRQSLEHRLYAECLDRGEFLCPLCKSLGNVMFPIKPVTKTESVNWSGSVSGTGGGVVPPDRGGAKNAFQGLPEWFTLLKQRLVQVWDQPGGMQTDGQHSFTFGGGASSSTVRPTRPGRSQPVSSLNDRRGSDASLSSTASNQRDQPELQDLIDRLMRLTDNNLTQGLVNSLQYTIVSLERSLRGVSSKSGEAENSALVQTGILELLSGNTLVFLRVMADSILQLNENQLSESSAEDRAKNSDARFQLNCIFAGMDNDLFPTRESLPCQIESRSFASLVMLTFTNDDLPVIYEPEDIYKWVALCFLQEVVRTVVAIVRSVSVHGDTWFKNDAVLRAALSSVSAKGFQDRKGKGPASMQSEMMEDVEFDLRTESQEHLTEMSHFLRFIMSGLGMDETASSFVLSSVSVSVVYALLRAMTLPYLRSTTIYLYTRFFIVPPTGAAGFGHVVTGSANSVQDEYDQLSAYLQIPSLWSVCSTATTVSDTFLSKLMYNWLAAYVEIETERVKQTQLLQIQASEMARQDLDSYRLERLITLDSPAPLSLIGLPNGLENLFADCFKKICNSCQKQIAEPALCLVCGTVVCALTFCCHKDKKGECNNHMKVCSGEVGIFFLVKKFKILLLHNEKGCTIDPPYLDIHGEVDSSRRKGYRQFLNLKRYDEIRKLWLTNGLPSFIARRVEATHSYGGWSQY